MAYHEETAVSYSQFACIGTGFSAIALGATLKRWYGISDIRFFERHTDLGGTWFANKFPGSACDVPTMMYSFSFDPYPEWQGTLGTSDELWEYLNVVAQKYDLRPKMVFNATVERCEWIEESHRWRISCRDGFTNALLIHESQILYGGSGILVHPRKLSIPGLENFDGPVFHSSRWRHDVDLDDKHVVLIGNGCTASQILPAIRGRTRHLTQFMRSKNWVVAPLTLPDSKLIQVLFRSMPGVQWIARLGAFLILENSLRGFFNTSKGTAFRQAHQQTAVEYIHSQAPEKYRHLLIPDFDIGCKRRVFDSGYLKALHADNVTLTDDAIVEVVSDGVRCSDGFVKADAIILATGFETNSFCTDIDIVGRNGVNLEEHWAEQNGPTAYNTTSISGFPNFFLLFGPNSATGHTSSIIAIENAINFSLRVIKPILQGKSSAVDVKQRAEDQFVDQVQQGLANTIFQSSCKSWYTRAKDGKPPFNSSTWPFSQGYFWYRCLFPTYRDFTYDAVKHPKNRSTLAGLSRMLLWTGALTVVGGVLLNGRKRGLDIAQLVAILRHQIVHLTKSISP